MGVKIVHLYPKELNLYGDSGNVLCLYKRLTDRGYKADVIEVGIGERIPDFDIMLIGGGQDKEMKIIEKDLKRKSEMINYSVNTGKVILAICGGYQLLGEYYKTSENEVITLSSSLPFHTISGKKRMIGNLLFETRLGEIVGFENHSGCTILDKDLEPFGKIIKGYGNTANCDYEGVFYKNTIGTYAHGPVLPKNPNLADYLIKQALKVDELKPLDDRIEQACHNTLIERLKRC